MKQPLFNLLNLGYNKDEGLLWLNLSLILLNSILQRNMDFKFLQLDLASQMRHSAVNLF